MVAPATTNFGQLKTLLKQRLSDPNAVYWTDVAGNSEIEGYLIEALRTWNALTCYFRVRTNLQTIPSVPFYDLSQLPERQYTVLDTDLQNAILYHLLEPSGPAWPGSEQFTPSDLAGALTRRRNQFLLETRSTLAYVTFPAPSSPVGRVPIIDTVADIVRAAWRDDAGVVTPLKKSDEFAFQVFRNDWNLNPDVKPKEFSIASTPPFIAAGSVQLSPVPQNNGSLECLVVQIPSDLGAGGVLVSIPDDFAWVVKFGALADLLGKEGPGKDDVRAQYCEQRYREGVTLATINNSILLTSLPVYVNDSQVQVDYIDNLDSFFPKWQTGQYQVGAQGTPSLVALAGMNMLAVAPVPNTPDAAAYDLTFDVIRNAPVPQQLSDQILIQREDLNAILDYAEHLAAFKQGAKEIIDTMGHYERLKRVAALHNEKLRNSSIFTDVPDEISRAKETPRSADQILTGG